jgi:hypothetical protein
MSTIPKIVLGPLLGVESDCDYSVCVLLDLGSAAECHNIKLSIDQKKIDASSCESIGKYHFLRFETVIKPDSEKSKSYTYHIAYKESNLVSTYGEDSFTFWVPAERKIPRIAFVSCCGFHNKPADDKCIKAHYSGWSKLLTTKTDLLVLTGDQIYSDRLWREVKEARKSFYNGRYSTDDISRKLDAFFLHQYIKSWGHPAMAKALATIPNVMTWDDHDIIDGYGSHVPAIQNSDLFNTIFSIASRYYELFQLRTKQNLSRYHQDSDADYTSYFTYRNFTFILPDTRSHRTRSQILGKTGFQILQDINSKINLSSYRYYDRKKNMNTICFVLPVPIAHRNFNAPFEQFMSVGTALVEKIWPYVTRISLDDDLVDHWDHDNHECEHIKMLELMYAFGEKHEPYSIMVVSGDVHSAGAASIVKDNLAICQLISSPIVNSPMNFFAKWLTSQFSRDQNKAGECTVTDLKHYGNSEEIIFNKRNFITVSDDYKDKRKDETMLHLKPVVNQDELADAMSSRSGKLIASLFLDPWTDKPYYRTINKFRK